MSQFRTVRGMRDFLPDEARMMRHVEGKARRTAELYGYREIMTPVVEPYELLSAKAGEEVRSRMFIFKDLGGRDVALRPEFTASIARVVATSLKNEPKPLRLFSVGSIYRYDEPQRGRYREFWQSNYELMGSSRPEADTEILLLTDSLMRSAGLDSFAVKIGHVGVLRGIFSQEELDDKVQNAVMQVMDKRQYDDALRMAKEHGLPDRALGVLRELTQLRGSDVSGVVTRMRDCVKGYDVAAEAVDNLGEILSLVSEGGSSIDVTVDAGFARGLEYYTGMIFEVNVPQMDIALGGGGRYDRLIELFGGETTPAVGVAHGIDRVMLALQMQKFKLEAEESKTVVVIAVTEKLRGEALRISGILREGGVPVEVEVMGRKMAKTLEDASKKKAGHAVIVGEREFKEGSVVLRDLEKREQKTVKTSKIADEIWK